MTAQTKITFFIPKRSARRPKKGQATAYITPLIEVKPETASLLQWNSELSGLKKRPKAKNIPTAPRTYATRATAIIFHPLAHSPRKFAASANPAPIAGTLLVRYAIVTPSLLLLKLQ